MDDAINDIDETRAAALRQALRSLIVPMVISLLLVGSVHIVDTVYLSILGDTALTAFSFILPIFVGANQVCMGFGIGVTSVIARANGAGSRDAIARLMTHTFVLTVVIGALMGVGLFTAESAVFRALGASAVEEPLIRGFVRLWIPGILFTVLNAWGTATLRGLGETRSTALVMLVQAVVNLAVAPILMFGLGPVHALGIGGAGLALTVAAGCASLVTGRLLFKRRDVLAFSLSPSRFFESARATLAVALPAILTYTLVPIATAIFTRWISAFGGEAVAAFGVATRFETFIVMVPLAIGAGLGPFVGHHYGAGKLAELRYATRWCARLVLSWGAAATLLLVALAIPIGTWLADTPALADKIATALCIVPLGFASYGVITIASAVYNNVGQASRTAAFAALRTLAFALPVGALAGHMFGFYGLYAALPLASIITERIASRQLRIDGFSLTSQPKAVVEAIGAR